jgi:apolipoprotein N-acyltransferase
VPSFAQLAAYVGPYAITAALVAASACLYVAWRRRKIRYVLGALASLAVLGLPALAPVALDAGPAKRAASCRRSSIRT